MTEPLYNNRIKWQCRRGQLELDILLHSFLGSHYESLDIEEKLAFEKLLTHSDPELYACLIENVLPQDVSLVGIIEQVKSHTIHAKF